MIIYVAGGRLFVGITLQQLKYLHDFLPLVIDNDALCFHAWSVLLFPVVVPHEHVVLSVVGIDIRGLHLGHDKQVPN